MCQRVWKRITLSVPMWLLHVTNEYSLLDTWVELLL